MALEKRSSGHIGSDASAAPTPRAPRPLEWRRGDPQQQHAHLLHFFAHCQPHIARAHQRRPAPIVSHPIPNHSTAAAAARRALARPMSARPPRVQVTRQHVQAAHDDDTAMSASAGSHEAWLSSPTGGDASLPLPLPIPDADDPDLLDHVRARLRLHLDDFLHLSLIQRIAQVAFVQCIWVHMVFVILILGSVELLDPTVLHTANPVTNPLRGLLIILVLGQVSMVLLAHVAMVRELSAHYSTVRPWAIFCMYMGLLVCFASGFFAMFACDRSSFGIAGYTPDRDPSAPPDSEPIDGGEGSLQSATRYNSGAAVYIFLCYYSATIITSTGFGDIQPLAWHAQMLSNLEMLVGMVYSVWVFGLALNHFIQLQDRKKKAQQIEHARLHRMAKRKARALSIMTGATTPQSQSQREPPSHGHSTPYVPDISLTPLPPPDHPSGAGASLYGAGASSVSSSDDDHDHGHDVHERKTNTRTRAAAATDSDLPGWEGSMHPQQREGVPSTPPRPLPPLIIDNDSDGPHPRWAPSGDPFSTPSHQQRASAEEDLTGGGAHVPHLGALEPMEFTPRHGMPKPPDSAVAAARAAGAPSHIFFPSTRLSSSALAASLPATLRISRHAGSLGAFADKWSFWRRLRRDPRFERARRFVNARLLLIELAMQMLSASLMYLVDDPFTGLDRSDTDNYVSKIVVLSFASLLLVLQVTLALLTSLRLLSKISGGSFTEVIDARGRVVARVAKEGISASFLAQAYVSTILMYGSVYYFLFAFMPTHEFSRTKEGYQMVSDVWFTMIYFSTTVMTGTGFGDFYARGVMSRIVALSEMVLSVVYTSIFIGLGMFVMCEQLRTRASEDLAEKERKLKQIVEARAAQRSRSASNASAKGKAHGFGDAAHALHAGDLDLSDAIPEEKEGETEDPDTETEAAAVDEPPLLDLLHHPELLEQLALNQDEHQPNADELRLRMLAEANDDLDHLLLTGGSDMSTSEHHMTRQ